jgi:hypothetical protein
MSKKIEMVRVYDFETRKAISIPARELAAGMVKVTIQGREGEFWVEASKLLVLAFAPWLISPVLCRARSLAVLMLDSRIAAPVRCNGSFGPDVFPRRREQSSFSFLSQATANMPLP